MKKIRSVFAILIAIVSLVALASCGNNATLEIVNVTTMRTRIGVTIKVNDPDEQISSGSIAARLYDEDESLVSSLVFDELAEEEEYQVFDDLEENTTYRLVIKATVNKKSVTFLKKNYTTTTVGATEEDPVIISTVEDFINIKYDDDAYYKLVNNIDFTDVEGEQYEFDTLFNKTSPFYGHIDGAGYTISGLNITNTLVYSGILGYMAQGSSVKDLTIKDVTLKSTKGSELYLGVLAGCNEGVIDNVNVENVTITHEGTGTTKQYIGGLVGVNTNIITDSSVKNVTMTLRSRLLSTVGGFVGCNGGIVHTAQANAYISGCSATGIEITTNHVATRVITDDEDEKEYIQYTGGFVGETRIDILDSYAEATITASASYITDSYVKVYSVAVGGFAGRTINGCKIVGVAAVSTLNVTSNDAYELNVGVLVGAAYDTLFKNCYGMLDGENSVISKSSYDNLSDDIKTYLDETLDAFEINFAVIGYIGDVLTETVSKEENVLFMLTCDGTILTEEKNTVTLEESSNDNTSEDEEDEVEDTTVGYVEFSGVVASSFDLTVLSDNVKNFLNTYFE